MARVKLIKFKLKTDQEKKLSHVDILFSESNVTLIWSNVLKEIRDNPENFVRDGGWAFLQDSDNEEDEDEEENDGDSEFSVNSEVSELNPIYK